MTIRNSHDGDDGARQRSASRNASLAPFLPASKAPANDNDVELMSSVRAFFGRHVNWLIPTLALALFSFALLFR